MEDKGILMQSDLRSDKEVQENPYTEDEWRDMKYRDYLELKKEFEGDAFR